MFNVLAIALLSGAAGICIETWANNAFLTKLARLLFGGAVLVAIIALSPASSSGLIPLWWSVGYLFAFRFLHAEGPRDVRDSSEA